MTFEEYAQANAPGLLRLAGVLSGDRHLAEDVVQEVLFRAYERWEHVSAAASPEAYLRRMVVNEYLSWRRKWARIVPRAEVDPGNLSPDPAETVATRDELSTRLTALPPRQRAVLVLRYYEGMTDSEVAEALGCSNGTVRSTASRALAALRVAAVDSDLLLCWED